MKAFLALVRISLWQRRWFIVWWTIGICAFVAINIALYPSFRDQAAELNKSLAQLPKGLVDLFSDNGDFLSPIGFLSSQIFYLLLPMLFSIMTITLGASLLAREEQRGTIEMLLARPVSRTKVLLAKMTAGWLIMAISGLIVAVVCAVLVKVIDFGVPMRFIALTALTSLILAILFGTVAFAISAFGRTARGAAAGLAGLVAFGGYLASSLSNTVHWLEWPARLLPYHYYQPSDILRSNPNWTGIGGLAVVILLLAVVAWVGFRRRDIG